MRQWVDTTARQPAILDKSRGYTGADCYALAVIYDLRQLWNAGQIDQRMRRCEPQIQHRAERLAAGDEPRAAVAFGQDSGRIRERRRSDQIER